MAPPLNPETLRQDPALAGLAAGARVGGGRFVLVRPLGQGGMGVVWLARDEHLGEDVALKFLPPEIRGDAAALDDLRRETSRSRKLTHPNIIRIHDLYKVEQEAFISMEYVDGPNLTERRLEHGDRTLTWSFLEPIVRQLCEALSYAHGESIVHRDLKPANMMLDARGRLKLADFGIAATVSDSISRVSVARHSLSGTASYMSPQQLDGQMPQVTDDVYSLGSTLYELLTSRAPFFTGDIPHQVRSLPPQPIEKRLGQLRLENPVPPAVSATIMACLAKDPAARPQSATEIAQALGLNGASHHEPGERPAAASEPTPGAVAPPMPEARAERSSPKLTASIPPAPEPSVRPTLQPPAAVPDPIAAQPESLNTGSPRPGTPRIAHDGNGRSRVLIAIPILLVLLAVAGAAWWQSNYSGRTTKATAAVPQEEFISLFNGHDFSGWEGDPTIWTIKDRAMTATAGTSKEKRPVAVFWRGTVDDFELRLSFRLENGNSGIYYRARQLLGNEVGGYQFEISGDRTGALLESGADRLRRDPSRIGSTVTANVVNGREKVTVEGPLGGNAAMLKQAFRPREWNDVVIMVRGNHVIHKLNGQTMIETRDEFSQRPKSGTVAFEVYGLVPTTVQFRDIRLKRLSPEAVAR
jgi:serine/threonine protein kinase